METVKPSRAAMELAGDIADLLPRGFPDKRTFEEAKRLIQSALADLLEKAEIVATECSGPSHMLDELTAALEPWKDGK